MSLNEDLAQRLAMIAKLQDLLGADRFRAISNERASRAIEGIAEDVRDLAKDRARLLAIDGIGPKIADKVIEFVNTGRIAELDELSAQVPPGVLKMMEIPGMGPKTAALIWREGGIDTVDKLKVAIDEALAQGEKPGKAPKTGLLALPRMGVKSIQKLKESMAFAAEGQQRVPLGIAMPIAEDFVRSMLKVPHVKDATFAGSLRRGRDTIGDIDILVCVDDLKHAPKVAETFRALPRVKHILSAGDTRSSVRASIRSASGRITEGTEGDADVRTKGGEVEDIAGHTVQVDLRVLPIESWGAALMYFTGSKEHNVRLRERAQKRGQTLNDYGLFPEDHQDTPPQERGIKPVAGKTEESVYKALGVQYFPPEIREDRGGGEIDLASLPTLIELADIKAELHAHTTASDGALSIDELATEAKRRGFHTIAVTDHSKSSAIAGGLTVDRLLQHIEDVHKANERVKGIRILAGSEVDILADGTLDYEDKVLKQLDVVVASPHTALSQDSETATKRLLKAIKNPYVHIIGHPTGRLVNRRPGFSPEMSKLIAAAVEHNVALEINAHWMRLDLRDVHVRAATAAGCLIAIDCDVHALSDFDNLRYGVVTGRRGWLTADLCINAWPAKKLHDWLASKR